MTNSSIFDLFSRLRQPRGGSEAVTLNVFGKLPIYKDFISIGLTEKPAQEFKDWISNGFSKRYAAREEYRGGVIPQFSFLLRLPESGRCVAGVLWGSHDEGGLRQFPFTLFCVVPDSRTFTFPLVALDYLRVFEQHAGEIRRNYQSGGALQAFYSVYRGLRLEVPARAADQVEAEARDALNDITVEEFANSIPGVHSAENWRKLTAGIRHGMTSTEHVQDGAVRFPTGERLRPALQMQFWLLWALGSPAGRKAAVPSGFLFESRPYESGRGTFLFRSIRTDDFLLFHPTHADYEFVEEVQPPGVPADASASGGPNAGGPATGGSPSAEEAGGDWDRPMASLLPRLEER